MINERKPLNMCEVSEILKEVNETDKTKEIKSFIKKFNNTAIEKGKKLKKELENLGLIKIKNADIAKLIDLLPEEAVELNKILTDVTLDADETNKILETIKQNK